MHLGMVLQVLALLMLTVPDSWLFVMFAQALSGIAKDLNKMSAKSGVKSLVSTAKQNPKLFKWVAVLTGSKNALKGLGFFLGAFLLDVTGFRTALWILAVFLLVVLVITFIKLPQEFGKAKNKPKFTQVFSNTKEINWLSAARFFLFGAHDIWFVVALPVFLYEVLGWSFSQVGSFIALWIIGYGLIQTLSPNILKRHIPTGLTAQLLVFLFAVIPAGIAIFLSFNFNPTMIIVVGLLLFGMVFVVNVRYKATLDSEWPLG